MGPFDIGKFVEDLFQWEPHRIGALVTGLVLGASLAVWVWRSRSGQVKELEAKNTDLDAKNGKLREESNRLWDRNASLQETIEELRNKIKEIEQQVELPVARVLEQARIASEEEDEEEEEGEEEEEEEGGGDVAGANGRGEARRYWVIAPCSAEEPEKYRRVLQFDLENKLISIGWVELGDISSYDKSQLRQEIDRVYPNDTPRRRAQSFSILWNFYHSIKVGDTIIARQGTKKIAAVGTVRRVAYYKPNSSPARQSHHIDVDWHPSPRDKTFPKAVFGLQTVYAIPETRFEYLLGKVGGEQGSDGGDNDTTALTPTEVAILEALARSPKTKEQLWELGGTSKVLGAASKEDYGVQGGGLLGKGLIEAKKKEGQARQYLYFISAAGRNALARAKRKS